MMPSQRISKGIVIAILVIAILGFADATYLAVQHFIGGIPPCSDGFGCEKVTTSVYSEIAGIPVALLGALYYLAVIVLSIITLDTKNEKVAKVLFSISVGGLLAAIWFTSLQFFVIKELCPYCLFSGLSSTVIFILSCIGWKKLRA